MKRKKKKKRLTLAQSKVTKDKQAYNHTVKSDTLTKQLDYCVTAFQPSSKDATHSKKVKLDIDKPKGKGGSPSNECRYFTNQILTGYKVKEDEQQHVYDLIIYDILCSWTTITLLKKFRQ